MPGITGDIFLRAASNIDLTSRDSPQNMSESQFENLQNECCVLLGLGKEWADESYSAAVTKARLSGWGTKYGPGSPPAQKVHKAPSGTKQDSLHPDLRVAT